MQTKNFMPRKTNINIRNISCSPQPMLSRVQFFGIPWAVAHQTSLSTQSLGKDTGMGCPFLLQGDLPDPGIEPTSLVPPVLTGRFFYWCTTWEVLHKLLSAGEYSEYCFYQLWWNIYKRRTSDKRKRQERFPHKNWLCAKNTVTCRSQR